MYTLLSMYAVLWFCIFGAACIGMNRHTAWLENIGATEFVNAGTLSWSSGAGRCFAVLATIPGGALRAHSVNINMSPVCKNSEKFAKNLGELPAIGLKIMMNVPNPESAFSFGQLPNADIVLAPFEFVINNAIRVRPTALLNYDTLDGEHKVLDDQCRWGYSLL